MKDRFSSDVMNLFNLNIFLPRTSYKDTDLTIIREIAKEYKGLLNVPLSPIFSEYELWIAKWKRKALETEEKDISDCLLNTIEECDKGMYSMQKKYSST